MRTLCLLIVGVVVGWAASGVDWSRDVVGEESIIDAARSATPITATTQPTLTQVPVNRKNSQGISVTTWEQRPLQVASQPNLVGRFQTSAYGSPSGHGCYIVDTMTGRTWHVANGQPPQVVAEALSGQAAQQQQQQQRYEYPSPVPTPSVTPMPDASDDATSAERPESSISEPGQ
jgi:hypothetical protein